MTRRCSLDMLEAFAATCETFVVVKKTCGSDQLL